jgi:hypothetical protein
MGQIPIISGVSKDPQFHRNNILKTRKVSTEDSNGNNFEHYLSKELNKLKESVNLLPRRF